MNVNEDEYSALYNLGDVAQGFVKDEKTITDLFNAIKNYKEVRKQATYNDAENCESDSFCVSCGYCYECEDYDDDYAYSDSVSDESEDVSKNEKVIGTVESIISDLNNNLVKLRSYVKEVENEFKGFVDHGIVEALQAFEALDEVLPPKFKEHLKNRFESKS